MAARASCLAPHATRRLARSGWRVLFLGYVEESYRAVAPKLLAADGED